MRALGRSGTADKRVQSLSPDVQSLSPAVKTGDQLLPHNGTAISVTKLRPSRKRNFMKRASIGVVVALSAISSVGTVGTLVGSSMASAAAPSTTTTTCNNAVWNANGNVDINHPLSSVISTNLYVPPGAVCGLSGNEVQGNVSVQGSLVVYGATFDKNVSVTGGSFKGVNNAVTIAGNLSFLDPPQGSDNGFWGNQNGNNVVTGNLSYTIDSSTDYLCYNSPLLYFGGGTTVNGNFSYGDQGMGFAGHLSTVGLSAKSETIQLGTGTC
jgi:hypothetical protein